MTKEKDITNASIPIKTVVAIVVTIVMWLSSILGVYFTMKSQIDELRIDVNKQQAIIDKNNPEILELQITTLATQVTQLNSKADKIYEFLNNGNHH